MSRVLPAIVLFALLVGAGPAAAAEPHHALVRIPIDGPNDAAFLRTHRGRLDIVMHKPGVEAHVAARPDDLDFLQRSGVRFEILEEDLETARAYPNKGAGFGIFHTYSESVAFVDSLHLLHPDVVSAKWSIGTTIEGRDIWCFRVSDNPEVDEGEPEVLIDGMHHAREIMASEFPIMFAEYLAAGYGVDPEITWLVDNRELYIIPMVNPDGVVYNEATFPNGGGLWRKNRRNNGGSFGVDLNRNYPYQWGYDNIGSSGFPADTDYRGPTPASEPETQAMLAFIDGREIRTHDTIHTYSNLLLYPWAYVTTPTPHDATFDYMAARMTEFNGYEPGQPGSVLYDVNGGAFDWMYGETDGHTEILSFSTEIGSSSDGFWPAESRRGALFQENIWPHIYLMRAAGPFVAVRDAVVNAAPAKELADKAIAPGESGVLSFTVVNESAVSSLLGLDFTIRTDDPWIQLLAATRNVGALTALGSTTLDADPIPFTVDGACPEGHVVELTVTMHMAEGDLALPLSFVVGAPAVLLADDMESGLSNWQRTGSWNQVGTTYHSAGSSLTDSPLGDYLDETAYTATLASTVQATMLSFWHRYDIESGWDFGRVQVSADGGPWATVASYTGTQTGWVQVVLDLSAYLGSDLGLRFLMETDYSVTRDGWYIDDVVLEGAPSPDFGVARPVPVAPVGGATTGGQPALTVANSVNPGGGATDYGFRVYADALCTSLVASADNVAEMPVETSWVPATLPDGNYWWRAWAGDGTDRSDLSSPEPFTVSGASPVLLADSLGMRVLGSVTGSGSAFELSLPARTDVTLDVHDARGALVRRLHSGTLAGGVRVLSWDGRDRSGRNVASGVYFVRAQVGRQQLTGRVVVVR